MKIMIALYDAHAERKIALLSSSAIKENCEMHCFPNLIIYDVIWQVLE